MTGWKSAALGDLCEVVNGGTPKTGVAEYWGGPHRWITPAEMGKRSTPYVHQTERTITDQGLQNSSARLLPPYSVILSSRAPIGHLVINTEQMATNQGCEGLIPRGRINFKFLYYYLGSIVGLLNGLGTGATFKELSGGKLKEVLVPVPLLPTVLTTSQKLSTGVDARNVRNIVLLRPVASMIEFKQIIGRGTRLYDGKDHFTIYDFVKAHHHFSDPEWDGEPLAPEEPTPRPPRTGGDATDLPVREPAPPPYGEPPPARIKVKLADGKERAIQHMTATTFWSADGRPMSAAQFLDSLFGALPEFFKNEDELRKLWSDPDTRKKLLAELAERGFGKEPLAEMQKIIEAQNSDLFDVLAYVAFAASPQSRLQRAKHARQLAAAEFTDRQQAFIDFVLSQYVLQGVDELDHEKLSPLLRLKYRALPDAFAALGKPEQVRKLFVGFQRHLYAS